MGGYNSMQLSYIHFQLVLVPPDVEVLPFGCNAAPEYFWLLMTKYFGVIEGVKKVNEHQIVVEKELSH